MRMRGFSMASGSRPLAALTPALATVAILANIANIGCGDKTPNYPRCSSDKDCRKGEHCVNQQCRQCANDAHCKRGETCIDGGCRLGPGACNAESDCPAGQLCLQSRCAACREDSQCGPDRRCKSGRCLARGTCGRDEDCADDEDCVQGACTRPGRGKPPDVACRLEPVFFDFDQSRLGDDARAALGRDAECVQSAPGRGLLLSGFTDPRGTEEYNVALSEQRARTVADYLARLGIDPARFRVVPKGETLSAGSDASGWSRDRRVEIEWQ